MGLAEGNVVSIELEPGRWVKTGNLVRKPHKGGWTLCAECHCSRCGKLGYPQVRPNGDFRRNGLTRCCIGHGHTRGPASEPTRHSPEYNSWLSMKNRCRNPRCQDYGNYGGRGIRVCDRWVSDFAAFLADMGPRPLGTSLDRLDANGNYEPDNCRWATPQEQTHNKQTKYEHGAPLTQLAAAHGLTRERVRKRLKRGWDLQRALTTPMRPVKMWRAA